VLYYVDSERIALRGFDISKLDATHIECIATGEARDLQRHPPKLAVKAVTYHQLKVQQKTVGSLKYMLMFDGEHPAGVDQCIPVSHFPR
jgi:SHS2 domain-containing protein